MNLDKAVTASASPGGLAVSVAVPPPDPDPRVRTSTAAVSSVRVSTLDQKASAALGITGVLLAVASGGSAPSKPAPVELSVGYKMFANAYGGDFGARLQLVALPACAVTTPSVRDCRVQTPIGGSRNDRASTTVSATLDLGRSAAPTVVALTAGSSSETGDWGATPLSQTASWQAGSSGGDFTYQVPITMPPAPGGLVPDVSLSYSSGGVDGLTKSRNSQSSWVGEGWDYHPGYVERTYRPCRDDGVSYSGGDLCWVSLSPVTLVLNGKSTRLIDTGSGWKPEDDSDGWKVERLTGLANEAHDGEAFKVTTSDGTQYFFGSKPSTQYGGVLQVEVFGNDPGEPCHLDTGFSYSHCTMPYRWNLDRVVDVHGNAIDYEWWRFQGNYGGNGGADSFTYDIYGRLTAINYGANLNAGTGHTGRVEFEGLFRCFDTEEACNPYSSGNWYKWPDSPWDQYCQTWATTCGNVSPTFWNIYRLGAINTYVWQPGSSSWGSVGRWQLGQQYPANRDGTSPSLWLASVTRPGIANPLTAQGIDLDNRVDYGAGKPETVHWRVSQINTGYGSTVSVQYSARECNGSLPSTQDYNAKRCFPQNSLGTISWWHKYVVTDVSVADDLSQGPTELWHYDYSTYGSSTDVLWKHDQNYHVPPQYRTWSRWAGYPSVATTHSLLDGTGPKQVSETLYFRGMNGDWTAAGGAGARQVTLDDSWDHARPDDEALAGRTARSWDWDGPINGTRTNWTAATRHHYSITNTGSLYLTPPNPSIWANRVRQTETIHQTVMAGPTYRVTHTITEYEPTYGLPVKVTDEGDTTITTDDRCTTTTYATGGSTWLIGLPKTSMTTNCAANPTAADVLSATRTTYDDQILGLATRGLPTLTEAVAAATAYPLAGGDYHQTARFTYDAFGRVKDSFDALDRQTTTTYLPATGGPVTGSTVTGPTINGQRWDAVTTLDTRFGRPTKVVDVNGKATQAEYDAAGRLTKVWKDNRAITSTPDLEYAYWLGGPNAISTKSLRPDGTQLESIQIFDGVLRPRQTQAPAANGDTAVTDTVYNGIGAVAKTSSLPIAAAPSTTLQAFDDAFVPVQQRLVYDNLGRVTASQQWAGNSTTAAMLWQTTTSYDGDKTVTVTPPAGGTATTSVTDARGNTAELRQYHSFSDYLELVAGDFTNDGKTDMFAVQPGTGRRIVFYGNGDNTFTPGTTFPGNGWDTLRNWVAGKFDGDANLDAVGIRKSDGALMRYQGNGAGSLATPTSIGTGYGGYRELAGADFNGDGFTDLVGIRASDGMAFYFQAQSGGGGFAAPVGLGSAYAGLTHLVAGDADGDGKADLLAIRPSDNMLRRALGNGNGTFGVWTDLFVGWNRTNLAAGDFDGDGKADLFGAYPASLGDPLLKRWKGDGTTFTSIGSLPLAQGQAYDRTSYAYDRLGHLTGVTDPAANAWTYEYDLLGRKTKSIDPDAGASAIAYDDAGQITSSTDGRSLSLFFKYDTLGRKTETRQDSATGTLRISWVYDTLAKGQLTASTRYEGGLAYVQAVDSYDDAYRPLSTTYTVPGFGPLGGTLAYTVGSSYNADGTVATQTLPTAGGLPAETLTYGYTATGLPNRLSTSQGQGTYIDSTAYHYDGLVFRQYLGAPGKRTRVETNYNAAGRRLSSISVATETVGLPNDYGSSKLANDLYAYDPAGNVTLVRGTQNNLVDQQECFRYDGLRRLTQAWTQLSGSCSTPQRAGVDPYWRQWTFDLTGNRASETDKDATDTVWTYSVGSAKPHQVTSITGTGQKAGANRSFGYDLAGNAVSRSASGGATQTLTWNVEGHLASVADSTGTTSYVYDAAGSRLVSAGPDKKILFLPDGTQLEKTGSSDPLATRYYNGVAVRDSSGLRWIVGDHHATAFAQVDSATLAVNRKRTMPYGEDRTAAPSGWKGDKGFVGGTADATGLIHLGAREYDPTVGRFLSVDPIMDMSDPQQWNPYAYGGNSPATRSDPGGLKSLDDEEQRYENAPKSPSRTPSAGNGHHGCSGSTPGSRSASCPTPAQAPTEIPGCSGMTPGSRSASCPPLVGAKTTECTSSTPTSRSASCPAPAPPPTKSLFEMCKEAYTGCALRYLGYGTFGLCLDAGAAMISNIAGSGCVVGDKNGLFFTFTETHPGAAGDPRASWGWGLGAGASLQVSDATTKNSLADGARFGSGTVVYSYTLSTTTDKEGKDVHIHNFAGEAPLPLGGSGGGSYTYVSGYMFEGCGWWICNIGNSTK